jgi:hypothetical protein
MAQVAEWAQKLGEDPNQLAARLKAEGVQVLK